MNRTLVELCAGTASVSLRALVGQVVQPLTGYMGGKRQYANVIAEVRGYGRTRRWPLVRANDLTVGDLVCTRVANLARAFRVGRVVRTPDALLEQGHVVVRWRCRPSRGPLGLPVTVPASSLLRWPDRQRNFALPLETP